MNRYSKAKTILAIAGIITSFAFSGGEVADDVKVIMQENQKVALYIANPLELPISVELANSINGDVEYIAEASSDVYYARLLDLKELPEGGYTLKCEVAGKVYEKEILLNGDKPVLLAETSYEAPAIRQNRKNLIVTVPNANEDVSITIQKGSEVFFTDSPVYEGSFIKSYNIERFSPGEYSIRVQKGRDSYNYNFEVE